MSLLENVVELTTEALTTGGYEPTGAKSSAEANEVARPALVGHVDPRPRAIEPTARPGADRSEGSVGEAPGDGAEVAGTGEGASGGGGAGAPLGLDALGIGGRNPFLTRLPDAPDAGAGAKSGSVLLDRAREASLGMGPDGPARTELAQATRLGRSQINSYAVFRVTIGPDARVTRVEVTDNHSDTRDVWEEIAKAAEKALAGRPMRLSSKSPGAVLLIEISSLLQYPSGRTVGKPPKVTLGAGTVTAQGDLSDIGAKPLRVVHTRLLDWHDPG